MLLKIGYDFCELWKEVKQPFVLKWRRTFHSWAKSWFISLASMTVLITRNLSRDRPPSWKPGKRVTCTVARAPGVKQPTLGRTRNFSGDVVFNWNYSCHTPTIVRCVITLKDKMMELSVFCSSKVLTSSVPSLMKVMMLDGCTLRALPSETIFDSIWCWIT
jgi:hypothetical protein